MSNPPKDAAPSSCFPKSFFHKEHKKKAAENKDHDLDDFLGFIQRHERPSNPALHSVTSCVALQSLAGEAHLGMDEHGMTSSGRTHRLSNLHVVEDIYYSAVGRPETGKLDWKHFDPTAFRPLKLSLGRGTCSQVHLLQHIASGYLGAMKVVPPNKIFNARAELNVLAECVPSPFILLVIDAFTHERVSYIFLEYAPFRTLDDLTHVADGIGSEKSRMFALEILFALEYLHNRRIVHRDVKPENVFVLISGHVKLGDFSSSKFLDPNTNKMKGLCCTYVTRPPEVWDYDYYSYPVDVWAFGVSLYNIISNTWPIVHASKERQIIHVKKGDILFNEKFSPVAADIITRAVQSRPEDRWTVANLIDHSFFRSLKDPYPPPYTPNELLEMYSTHLAFGDEISFIHDMVAHLP